MRDSSLDYLRNLNAHGGILASLSVGSELARQSAIQHALDQASGATRFRDQIQAAFGGLEFAGVSEILRLQDEDRQRRIFSPSVVSWAYDTAILAQDLGLHGTLQSAQTPLDELAFKFATLNSLGFALDSLQVRAFAETSALAGLLNGPGHVGLELRLAASAFAVGDIPGMGSVRAYGSFMDAAGLALPHWPRVRTLSRGEQRRRMRAAVKGNAPARHVMQGISLTLRYERTLRVVIDDAMSRAYGDDWAEARLVLCECKDLLGRWKKSGGPDVLEEADFAHYARIMCDPEHFQTVFSEGFDDASELGRLLGVARSMRAKTAHGRPFTEEELRELRVTWRSLEKGMIALSDRFVIDAP
jgi:hypothetical protein